MNSRREVLAEQARQVSAAEQAKLDVTPVEVPLEFRNPPSIKEELQRYVRYEISRIGQEEGYESFQEADDLEEEDEPEWTSQYEVVDMEPESEESLDGTSTPPTAEAGEEPASSPASDAQAAEADSPPAK